MVFDGLVQRVGKLHQDIEEKAVKRARRAIRDNSFNELDHIDGNNEFGFHSRAIYFYSRDIKFHTLLGFYAWLGLGKMNPEDQLELENKLGLVGGTLSLHEASFGGLILGANQYLVPLQALGLLNDLPNSLSTLGVPQALGGLAFTVGYSILHRIRQANKGKPTWAIGITTPPANAIAVSYKYGPQAARDTWRDIKVGVEMLVGRPVADNYGCSGLKE